MALSPLITFREIISLMTSSGTDSQVKYSTGTYCTRVIEHVSRLRDGDGQSHGMAIAVDDLHGLKRQWRHTHGFALDFHHQKMILGGPGANAGALHVALRVAGAELTAGAADDETYTAGAVVRLADLKIMFVSIEYNLDAGGGEQLNPVLKLLETGAVQRSGSEGRMVEKGDYPQRMRLRKFRLHPVELRAVFEVGGPRRSGFRILGAIKGEEFRQIGVGEIVITRRLILWKSEIVENRRQIGLSLRFVAVMIAERGEERDAGDQGLVGRVKLGRPIDIVGSGMQRAAQESGDVAIDVVAHAEDEAHGIIGFRATLELVPHSSRDQVLGCPAGAKITDHEKHQPLG